VSDGHWSRRGFYSLGIPRLMGYKAHFIPDGAEKAVCGAVVGPITWYWFADAAYEDRCQRCVAIRERAAECELSAGPASGRQGS
jgi:hypothetical protein